MCTYKKIVFFYIIINLTYVSCSRILAVFPFQGKSHNVMFNALVTGLAKRNHQVDVITHFPAKNPPANYKVVVNLNGTLPPLTSYYTVDFITNIDITTLVATTPGNSVCELLGLEEMQKFIKNPPQDPPYDVIITEAFGANCFMGLGHIFNVPVIAVTSSTEMPWVADYTGNVDNLAFVQSFFKANFDRTKFFDRLLNVISHYWHMHKFQQLTEEIQTNLMRKYLSADIPNIRDVEKSLSLILINRHPVINGLKPVNPSFIDVSGLHLMGNELPKLSPEYQNWLDESKDGVVYFTFGSMVVVETLPLEVIQALYQSFSKIAPTRVLMKVDDENKLPPGLPKNIKTFSWIPQQAVLAHKNVRVFITHGGIMGTQEALYHGVPIIGIPLFSDQPQNIENLVRLNMAVSIHHSNITVSSLGEALSAVLNDPKYKENMSRYSKLFRDRPMSAMDTAAYWIEYVIQHGNVLRSPAFELTWWQLTLVDVHVFLFISLIAAIASIYYVMNYLSKKVSLLLVQIFLIKQSKKVKRQ